MSIEAINYFRAVRFGDRYPSRKLLMMLLADRADEDFSCFPSIGLLADEMETDRRAIQRLLKRLLEDGYLSIEDRKRDNKSTASSRYHLHGPWDGWAGSEGKSFDVVETKRKGFSPKEGNFRPREVKEEDPSSPAVFPQGNEGGGYETAPGAVVKPQGGGYETTGGAVPGPPLEPSVNPQENHHPEHSLRAPRSEAALPGGESDSGGRPSIEEMTGPGAAVAHQGRPGRAPGHPSNCICGQCSPRKVPQQPSGSLVDDMFNSFNWNG